MGADGAGMSAAHQALRTARARGRDLEVVALESSTHTSYSACGIPYWIAGDVPSGDDLVARTAAQHRALGVDLRMRHEATSLDLDHRRVEVRDHGSGTTLHIDFDEIMLATGAEPVMPEWTRSPSGEPLPGVLPVKTLDDGAAWRTLLDRRPGRTVVVGGGYIGVEAAETFARRGVPTVLVTRGAEPMSSTLVPAIAAAVRKGLEDLGVEVVTGSEVQAVGPDDHGTRVACVDGTAYRADVVAVGVGVQPRVALATDAGLPVGGLRARGALVPDDRQWVADGVWAAGDCCAVEDRLLHDHWYVPLGTHANKAGRVAGENIGGGSRRFPGSVGTAISRSGDVEFARTGLMPLWAHAMGMETAEVTLDSTTASGYMPQASPITVWALGEKGTGRLLGAQIVGGRGAGKRIDVLATALYAGLTADEVAYLDLAYAPPFSPTWDPVQIACRKLAERL